MKKRKISGFTLVEIIMTVVIISIVFSIGGYFVIQTINSSKEESNNLTVANIKNSARFYVEEFFDDISWQQSNDDITKKFSCIPIKELINKGFLKDDVVKKHNLPSYIIVTIDENSTIISEELDDGTCDNLANMVKVPTKEYCKDVTYSGNVEVLTKDAGTGFSFKNNIGENAGTYEVDVKLNEGYKWKDGTSGDKKLRCSIKKAIPDLEFNPKGIDNTGGIPIGTKVYVEVITKVPGTITVKSSNKEYIKANYDNVDKKIIVEFLSSREIDSSVTVTFTPEDTNNYQSISDKLIIGKPINKEIPLPTKEVYCKDSLLYNQEVQTLTKMPGEGMLFDNNTASAVGEHEVVAKLKYGYSWAGVSDDEKYTNKTFKCSIKNPEIVVNYDNNGGSGCTSKTVTYGNDYGELCTPTRTGYTFEGWYTAKTNGTKVTSNTKVTKSGNHSVYAIWTNSIYKITLNNNGATTEGTKYVYLKYGDGVYLDSAATSKISYSNPIIKPLKTNYIFKGYYNKKNGQGDLLINTSGSKNSKFTTKYFNSDATIYAYWVSKPSITCDNSSYSWSNSTGKTKITASNADGFEGTYYKKADDEEFTKTTSNPFTYSGMTYKINTYTTSGGGTNKVSKTCYTKFDNLKPYTPIFFDFSAGNYVSSFTETCSSLSTTSTSAHSCTVTVYRTYAGAAASINSYVSVDDQPSTTKSGRSGVTKIKSVYTLLSGGTCTGWQEYKTSSGWVTNDTCSSKYTSKKVITNYDAAGNASSTLTVNYVWK